MEFLYLYDEKDFSLIETKEIEIDYFGEEVRYGNDTKTEPPEASQDHIQVFDTIAQTWSIVEDHRGKEGYINNEWIKIKELGALPTGWSDNPPPHPEPTPEEAKENRIQAITQELNDIDKKSIRSERAVQLGRGTEADTKWLEQLDDQAITLRTELQQLTPKSKTKKSTPLKDIP